MEGTPDAEREVRAARNQAVFRAVNEKIAAANARFAELARTHVIACECADVGCVETLEIANEEYEQVRASPRRFAVLPGHVEPEVEYVVRESTAYWVVEKVGVAVAVIEATDPSAGNG